MRLLNLALAILVLTGTAAAQQSIRQIDFKNFSYPLRGTLLGHDGLEWLDTSRPQRQVRLVAGFDLTKASSFVMNGKDYAQLVGFELESVNYADLTGEGKDEAIVVLRYLSGGTQTTNYVYIYAFESGLPKLLAYCHTGDRAYSGLYKVYGSRGSLVFELFDPAKRSGDCCSEGLIVRRFRWQSDRFEPYGKPEYRFVPGQG